MSEVQATDRAAHRWRLAQARQLMFCYEQATGQPVLNVEEFMGWCAANPDAISHDSEGHVVPSAEAFRLTWPEDES
jgi:hypothetical protein